MKLRSGGTLVLACVLPLVVPGTPRPARAAPGEEYRVSSPHGATEPSLAIDARDPARWLIGTTGPGDEVRVHRSADAGVSWASSGLPLSGSCCHPDVAFGPRGGSAWTALLSWCTGDTCELDVYRSDDGGASWDGFERESPGNPRRILSQQAGPPALAVDRGEDSPFRGTVYVAWDEPDAIVLARSGDRGDTWDGVTVAQGPGERGRGVGVAVDPAGRVLVAWPVDGSREVHAAFSVDGGWSFGEPVTVASDESSWRWPLPSQESRQVRKRVAVAADPRAPGTFYLAWTDTTGPVEPVPADNHARVRMAVTRDGGATWEALAPHPGEDTASVDRWHPDVAVTGDGTVHVAWYETRWSTDRTGVDLVFTWSDDGGASWAESSRVTGVTSPNIEDVYEFGDRLALAAGGGRLGAAWTDNRPEGEETGDSVDAWAAELAPGAGPAPGRIPGSRDFPGPPLRVTRNADRVRVDLDWDEACGAADDYAVYEGIPGDPRSFAPVACTTGGATFLSLAPAGGARAFLVAAIRGGFEGSLGRDGDGTERPVPAEPCFPRWLGPCP